MKKKSKTILLGILIILLLSVIYIYNAEIKELALDIYNSFYRTVIEEDRYILLLRGLWSTLIISFSSIFLGTILGLIICSLRKNKILNVIFKLYVSVVRGIPITVLLLTFYYIVFATVNIEPLLVAIITFSLYFSAYASEIFNGAVNSINSSQIQSAWALGFNKIQAFKYIIFPQALTYSIPAYKNEVVSLIKLTSIAGYISIMDLTKASDIIRNRTYEAFFPLIITAVIYFLICYMVMKLLDILYVYVNPRYSNRRKKNVKGK